MRSRGAKQRDETDFVVRELAPWHIHWRRIKTYEGLYVSQPKPTRKNPKPQRQTIRVDSLDPLPKTQTFRTAKGKRKFHLTKQIQQTRKVIIVAKTTPTKKTKKAKTK